MLLSLCDGMVVVVGWVAMFSHFRVQPNYSVEVGLCFFCLVLGL